MHSPLSCVCPKPPKYCLVSVSDTLNPCVFSPLPPRPPINCLVPVSDMFIFSCVVVLLFFIQLVCKSPTGVIPSSIRGTLYILQGGTPYIQQGCKSTHTPGVHHTPIRVVHHTFNKVVNHPPGGTPYTKQDGTPYHSRFTSPDTYQNMLTYPYTLYMGISM